MADNPRHTLTKVKAYKGLLYTTTRQVEGKTYRAKNRSEQDRTLLVEHPYRPDFRLTSKDKPAERARDVYRFEVKLPAGQSASQTVTEERDVVSTVALTNADDNSVRFFVQQDVTSPKVKEALRNALELKGKVDGTRQVLAHANRQLADIERDQQRLRANLKETPPQAAAYQKYLAKLDSQETEVDNLRAQIKKLQDDELARQLGTLLTSWFAAKICAASVPSRPSRGVFNLSPHCPGRGRTLIPVDNGSGEGVPC